MSKKVILDVDTGSDDAVAIMTALGCEDGEILMLRIRLKILSGLFQHWEKVRLYIKARLPL